MSAAARAVLATGVLLAGVIGPAPQARAASGSEAAAFGSLPTVAGAPGPATGAITLRSAMTSDPNNAGSLERPAAPGGDLAFGAFQRGFFATALSEAMKRLKTNPKDGAAMALVGEIYAQGLAVNQNPVEAARWNKLASQEGNREATFSYAMALLSGDGVPKDRDAAAAMFAKAADQGHPGALYNLGALALAGTDGKPRDFEQAARFFQRAADAGDVDALYALATLTDAGRGVPADPMKATLLMKQAADRKHVGAAVEYAIRLFNGRGTPRDEAGAARYFLKAAAQGNPVAENRLARLYAAGRGVDKNMVEAAHWHILARAAGLPDPWLDDQLATLTAADRAKVEDVVRRQLGP